MTTLAQSGVELLQSDRSAGWAWESGSSPSLPGRHRLRGHVPPGRSALHARPLGPERAARARRAEGAGLLRLPAPPRGRPPHRSRAGRHPGRLRTGTQVSLFDVSNLAAPLVALPGEARRRLVLRGRVRPQGLPLLGAVRPRRDPGERLPRARGPSLLRGRGRLPHERRRPGGRAHHPRRRPAADLPGDRQLRPPRDHLGRQAPSSATSDSLAPVGWVPFRGDSAPSSGSPAARAQSRRRSRASGP